MTMFWGFYFWSLLAPRLISHMSVFTNETSVSQFLAVQKFSEHSVWFGQLISWALQFIYLYAAQIARYLSS